MQIGTRDTNLVTEDILSLIAAAATMAEEQNLSNQDPQAQRFEIEHHPTQKKSNQPKRSEDSPDIDTPDLDV